MLQLMLAPHSLPIECNLMQHFKMPLSFDKPPLSLNKNMHWGRKSRIVKALRHEAFTRAKFMRLPKSRRITVQLHYQPAQNRRRDEMNIVATSKPLIDGIVDAGIVPDDTPEYVHEFTPRIHDPQAGVKAACWLEIECSPM